MSPLPLLKHRVDAEIFRALQDPCGQRTPHLCHTGSFLDVRSLGRGGGVAKVVGPRMRRWWAPCKEAVRKR